eukprot:317629_1
MQTFFILIRCGGIHNYYSILEKSERVNAINFIYSIMVHEENKSFLLWNNNRNIYNVLSQEMISSGKLQNIFEFMQNRNNDMTSNNITNFLSIWAMLTYDSLNIKYIMKNDKLWRPLLTFVVYILSAVEYHLAYHEISGLWKILFDTIIYWKKKHFKHTIANQTKKCTLVMCFVMLSHKFWEWKKAEIYQAFISTTYSLNIYMKRHWIIQGVQHFYARVIYLGVFQKKYKYVIIPTVFASVIMGVHKYYSRSISSRTNDDKFKQCENEYWEIMDKLWEDANNAIDMVFLKSSNNSKRCSLFSCDKNGSMCKLQKCSRCKLTFYCCRNHQKKHWKLIHSEQCFIAE